MLRGTRWSVISTRRSCVHRGFAVWAILHRDDLKFQNGALFRSLKLFVLPLHWVFLQLMVRCFVRSLQVRYKYTRTLLLCLFWPQVVVGKAAVHFRKHRSARHRDRSIANKQHLAAKLNSWPQEIVPLHWPHSNCTSWCLACLKISSIQKVLAEVMKVWMRLPLSDLEHGIFMLFLG